MWTHSTEATRKLLSMSESTVKRKVGRFMKARTPRKGVSATKPSHIKSIIPIFTGPWEGKPPGYGQIDTVVHCGSRLSGNMAYSVNYTDVSTLWVVLGAQLNKGQMATRTSLEKMKMRVPFCIHGMHPDTGSEFVNFHLKDWCDKEGIELTRSRPNHKNDNAYVEQKNGHVIRRFLGYSRIDTLEAISAMNELYDVLEVYLNHFVGSRKCLEKVRIGSRYRRKYDKARPAYQRVLESPYVDQDVKKKLRKEHSYLNPLLLKKDVDRLVSKVFKLQRECGNNF